MTPRLAHWRHQLFCSRRDAMIERAPGEVFLRCANCGLRSPGLTTGPLRVVKKFDGNPERFQSLRLIWSKRRQG